MLPYKLLLLFLVALISSCGTPGRRMDNRITLKRLDKIPYGTFVTYQNLSFIFPDAYIETTRESPSTVGSYIKNHTYETYDTGADRRRALYVIITPEFNPDKKEYETLMHFIGAGNHVFVSSFQFGREFSDSMKLSAWSYYPFLEEDSLKVNIYHPLNSDSFQFTYPGLGTGASFNRYDSTYAAILGTDGTKSVDFIRHRYTGGGSLFIHTDPLALTNFFLLHKQNKKYYDNVFSYLPDNIDHIVWDEYFRYGKKFNALQVILGNKGLSAAFWLSLLIFALIYLFESKRKQRIVPIRQPLSNSSLDFVKTVGILYYQYRDNKNLVTKMTAHLWDHIRRRYHLTASTVDERFIDHLSDKSGYDKQKLQNLMYYTKMMNDMPFVSDDELMELHQQVEDFYKI